MQITKHFLSVDLVVFGLDKQDDLRILLVKRALQPYKDEWALPGGFVRDGENLEQAARRELMEETGVRDLFLEQLYTFSTLERDPRGQVITVAYYGLVNLKQHPLQAATDAADAQWISLGAWSQLAFDHQKIIDVALQRLNSKLRYQPIGFELLPPKFTLTALQNLYESILGQNLNRRNFRSKILKMGILIQVERQKDVAHRPAFLYRFDRERYKKLTEKGFEFAISVPKDKKNEA